jgi:hypothetical protein
MVVCMLAGCAGSGSGGGGGTKKPTKPTGACKPPKTPSVTLSGNIQPIFNKSCALAGCHLGASSINGQDLSTGNARKSSVNVPVVQKQGFKRIVPGKPNDSYLYLKLIGDPSISGVLMPQGCPGAPLAGAACLTADEIAAIRAWIVECALDN